MQKSLITLLVAIGITPALSYALQKSISISDCDGHVLATEVTRDGVSPSVIVVTSSPEAKEVTLSSDASVVKAKVANKSATFLDVAVGEYKACTEGKIDSIIFGGEQGSSAFQMASIAIGGGATLGGLAMAFDEGNSASASGLGDRESSFSEKGPNATGEVSQKPAQGSSASRSPRPFAAEEDCLNDEDAKEIPVSPFN